MGRQAYLTKIALGRSAFEPSQTFTKTSEYIQLSSSQQELPAEVRDLASNKYIQLYDERGNPINPRAHEHGRRLREAQNDVLASIGVVEWRRSPSQDLPGSYADRLQRLEEENFTGEAISHTYGFAREMCLWWIGSLRDRVLTFHFDALPFTQLIATEWSMSSRSLVVSGLESKFLSDFSIESFVEASKTLRPLDLLLASTATGGKTRRFFRLCRPLTRFCFHLSVELLFYPLAYLSCLQRLGLVPARPVFPPLKEFLPFSTSSPLLPYSLHYNATASLQSFVLATFTSPFVFISMRHLYESWGYSHITDALEVAIAHPENPDIRSLDGGRRTRRSSPLVQRAIDNLTAWLGWRHPSTAQGEPDRAQQLIPHDITRNNRTIEVGGSEVTSLSLLELPLSHQEPRGNDRVHVPVGLVSDVLPPPSPLGSPTASQTSQSDDNDPRIRITSREGIVEMEVRLPPHVVTQHTEIVESDPPTPSLHDVASSHPLRMTIPQTYHRVTQLSLEPSNMLATMCARQIVNLASLPLSIVGFRLVASHYLASRDGYINPRRVLSPFPSLRDFSWTAISVQASRIAMFSALEFAIDLGLWGFEYLAITWTGENLLGWGRL